MKWTVETLNSTIDAELDQLPPDMRARFKPRRRNRCFQPDLFLLDRYIFTT
jgi:hypothetical protein